MALMWIALHLAGVALVHVWHLPVVYWGVFLAVELAGLKWGFPFTWTVRAFLRGATGRWGFWRAFVVAGWCAWLLVTWVVYAPFPPLVVGLVLVGFGVWVRVHLIGDRW